MNRGLKITAISLFIILLALTIFFIFIRRGDKAGINQDLIKIDTLISQEEFENAKKSLRQLNKKSYDRYNYLRLIKRGFTISEISNDYSLLLEISESAFNSFPGSEELAAYYVFSLSKTGSIETSYDIADKYLISVGYKSLLAQVTLEREIEAVNEDSLFNLINSKKDPVYYEYLANLLDERGLIIDAALIWAKEGELEKAYKLLKSVEDEDLKEALALLSYDTGRKKETLERLINLPVSDSIKVSNLKLLGDLFYMDKNWSRSRFYYEEALKVDPLLASPYINISSIHINNNQYKKALEILESGIDVFKEDLHLLVSDIERNRDELNNEQDQNRSDIVKRSIDKKGNRLTTLRDQYRNLVLLYYNLNSEVDVKGSLKALEEYKRLFPEDIKVDLLITKNKSELYDPDVYEARLWKLLNSDGDNREVAEYLIWYLLGLENYRDIELILERTNNRSEDNNWTNYYKAIVCGLKGEFQEALTYINMVGVNTLPLWEIYYTKGVLLTGANKLTEALESFNKSLIALKGEDYLENKNLYISEIKTKTAEILISLDDIDEAIRLLNSAYELNPDNYRSDLLRSINKSIKERS